jgi:hypothetical protein
MEGVPVKHPHDLYLEFTTEDAERASLDSTEPPPVSCLHIFGDLVCQWCGEIVDVRQIV